MPHLKLQWPIKKVGKRNVLWWIFIHDYGDETIHVTLCREKWTTTNSRTTKISRARMIRIVYLALRLGYTMEFDKQEGGILYVFKHKHLNRIF